MPNPFLMQPPSGSLVLLVDDESDLVEGLRGTLVAAGFQVAAAADGAEALAAFHRVHPAIVVLDLMLPGQDGLDVCRELRQCSDVPILMLTARADDVDRILGVELGADDYLTKPFNSRELVARLRAILRRTRRSFTGGTEVYAAGRLRIDFAAQQVVVDGEPAPLTPTEFALLAPAGRRGSRSPRPAPAAPHGGRAHPAPAAEDRGRPLPSGADPHPLRCGVLLCAGRLACAGA